MNFCEIETLLRPQSLKNPELDILKPDTELYETLMLQPTGKIAGDINHVSNSDVFKHEKHSEFIKLGKSKNASLVITPEYSTPWHTIKTLLEGNVFPEVKKIWIIGAESISKEEINAFKFEQTGKIKVLFENIESVTGNFLDPVCFFFMTENDEGELEKVIVIQFKTKPMGDAPYFFERDNLIRGKDIYIFKDPHPNSIRLITLVCADVLDIRQEDIDRIITRSLIVHIQLNPAPRSQTYSAYRKFCFSALPNDCEVLCLNWAKDVECDNKNWNHFSGSGIYIKSDKLNCADERLNSNHVGGLYLTFWKRVKTYAYFFNSDELVFHFRATKPWQHYGTVQQSGRSGPELLSAFSFTNNTWEIANNLNDGFDSEIRNIEGNFSHLKVQHFKPINVERLIALSLGQANGNSWSDIHNLASFEIKDEEVINRISFAQDTEEMAKTFRDQNLRLFSVFVHILESEQLPVWVRSVGADFKLELSQKFSSSNLFSLDGTQYATLVYLGENPSQSRIERVHSNLVSMLVEKKLDSKRILIWYKDLQGRNMHYPKNVSPTIDSESGEDCISINRGSHVGV